MRAAAFIRRQDRITFLIVAIGLVIALLLIPVGNAVRPGHDGGPNSLTLTWVDGDSHLRITGDGFRGRSPVDVRIGSKPWTSTRADATGTITVDIPREVAAAGAPGTSVVVSGRASSGTSRVLVSAVPPHAAARGPIDLLPWSVGAVVLLVLVGAAIRRFGRFTPRPRAKVSIM